MLNLVQQLRVLTLVQQLHGNMWQRGSLYRCLLTVSVILPSVSVCAYLNL
jgi:hypothetical protein